MEIFDLFCLTSSTSHAKVSALMDDSKQQQPNAPGIYRISMGHGSMQYLLGSVYADENTAVRAATNIFTSASMSYKARTGRRGQPPTVRVYRMVEELR